MDLLERKGSDLPFVFLVLLLAIITGYTGLMFYMEGYFVPSIVSLGLSLIFIWVILDRSVF